jgi:hypothetical protein
MSQHRLHAIWIIMAGCLFFIYAGCQNKPGQSFIEPLRDVNVTRNGDCDSADLLSAIQNAWERYSSDSIEGNNWRKFRIGYTRTEVFDRALIAYWEMEDRFPDGGSVTEKLNELENRKLIPFWPIDPGNGNEIRLVSDPAMVFDYADVYAEIGANGAFDYVMELYRNSSPFSPYTDQLMMSHGLSNLSRYIYPEALEGDPVAISRLSSEAFSRMIQVWFRYLVMESFFLNHGQVPLTLNELLAKSLIINEKGWGHPAGGVSPGEVGDFEFGVDPNLTAFYMITVSELNGRTESAWQFVQSNINGEMVYDITGPSSCIIPVKFSDLASRLPLLTDDLFASPPPIQD